MVRAAPLTATGTVVLGVGLVFFARGVWLQDVYRLTLGFLAIAAPLVAAVAAWLQAGRFAGFELRWEAGADTVATMADARRWGSLRALLDGETPRHPWLFFRIHAIARGFVQVGQNERLHFFDAVAAVDPAHLRIPLAVPLPGRALLRAEVQVRDTFGLARARLSRPVDTVVVIPPGLPRAPQLIRTPATSGQEESTRTRSPEEERYYMREYIAGDRFRDINWKASSRIRQLYTRISPQTQEESKTLTIYLRHFCANDRRSVEALAHVAYIKGWLLSLMHTLRHEDEGLSFRVVTARGVTSCTNADEITQFAYDVADLWATDEPPATLGASGAAAVFGSGGGGSAIGTAGSGFGGGSAIGTAGSGSGGGSAASVDNADRGVAGAPSSAIVFTTPFDRGLDVFVAQHRRTTMTIFATQLSGMRGNAEVHSEDEATVLFGGHLLPVPMLRLRTVQPAGWRGGAIVGARACVG